MFTYIKDASRGKFQGTGTAHIQQKRIYNYLIFFSDPDRTVPVWSVYGPKTKIEKKYAPVPVLITIIPVLKTMKCP
jgi:hypothetical protein